MRGCSELDLGKIEIVSRARVGEPALAEFRPPFAAAPGFPTSAKSPVYCHGQHHNLAKLRRMEPAPLAELSPQTAAMRGIGEGDWLAITTPQGRVRSRARLKLDTRRPPQALSQAVAGDAADFLEPAWPALTFVLALRRPPPLCTLRVIA